MDADRSVGSQIVCEANCLAGRGLYGRWVKRVIDLVTALFIVILLGPVLILLALLVRVFLGSPTLFRQERIGLRARRFVLYKFRTMAVDSSEGSTPAVERLTRFGRFLRMSSLDELPQIFNVLAGSMSLVGPRPLLPEYLPLYTSAQMRRHEVRPGISGWAQIRGRNAISWEKKFELDVWYVDHISFGLDARVLWLTIGSLLRGKGIDQPGRVGADRFVGNG